MTEKYILTGNVQNGRQYQITDIEEDYAYRNNKKDKQKLCNLLNKLVEEKEILEVQLKSATNEIDKLNTEINMLTDTCHDCCKEIRKENEQLKQQNKILRTNVGKLTDDVKYLRNLPSTHQKENKQLKEENKELKKHIQELENRLYITG